MAAPTDNKSPFAGCTIFILAGLIVIGVIFWAIYSLKFQEREIAKFTQETASPRPLLKVDENTSALNDLKHRLNTFAEDLQGGRKAKLELKADDMNLGISAFDEFNELRETFFVEKIEAGKMQVGINYKLGNSLFSKRNNHLIGTAFAKPELHPGEVVLEIDKISVPGAELPKEFLDHLSKHRITEKYKDHPVLGAAMKKLTSIGVKDDSIELVADPAAAPVTVTKPEDLKTNVNKSIKLFGIIACAFLLGVALIIIIGRSYVASKS